MTNVSHRLSVVSLLFAAVVVVATTALAGAADSASSGLDRKNGGEPAIRRPGGFYAENRRAYAAGPSLAIAPNGRLWATWHAGITPGEDKNGYIVLVTSADDGQTWQDVAIADPDGDGPLSMSDPQVWVDPDGRLRWSFSERMRLGKGTAELVDGEGRTCLLGMVTFPDAKVVPKEYPPARCIGPGVMMGKPVVLADGTWLLPVARWHREQSSGVMTSRDRGQTWSWVGGATLPKTDRTFDEHSIVQDVSGALHCYSRSCRDIFHAVSRDGGRSWTESDESRIKQPSARFLVRKLSSGRWLLVKHGGFDRRIGRSHLTAWLSDDEGNTWKGGLLLDERNNVSYPDCDQRADGLVYVVYDCERTKAREVSFATFAEADVLAGRNVSGKLRLRQRICGLPELHAAWEVVPCWGGGYVQGAAFCPSDPERLYTYVDVGGPYRSDDRGLTWRPLHANMPVEMRERGMDEVRSMSVDPRDADSFVILAGGGAENPGGFAYTRDGGVTWTVAQTARVYGNGSRRCEGFCLTRNPFNPDHLAGGEDLDGIWISRDNGATWRSTGPTNMWYTDVRYDATVTNRIYAASPFIDPQVLKTWWCAGESRMTPRSQGFFRSDDDGLTWRKLSDESPSEIAQIPGDRRIIGIFGHARIRVSDDGGETWRPFEDGLYVNPGGPKDPWSGGNYFAMCAGRDFWLLGDGNGTKYRRGRGDAAWKRLPRGRYYAGDPANEPRLANTAPEKGGMVALMTFVADPNDDRHWFTTDWFELWETKDAGETWTTRVRNIMQLVSYDVCFDPASPLNFCCCLYDMGLFLTVDGGKSFLRPETRNLGSRRFPNNMATVLYLRGRPGTVLGIGARGFDTGLWRSRDSGRVWEPVDAQGLPAFVPGKSAASALVEDEGDGSVLMTVSGKVGKGAGGVYRSRDAGLTWSWEGEGLALDDALDYGINHSQGAWPRLVRSPDGSMLTGGKEGRWLQCRAAGTNEWRKSNMWPPTWKRYPLAADPFVPGRFFRGSEWDTRETTDGGKTWHKFAPLDGKACRAIAFDRHNRGLVAFGCKDGIFVSCDGGATVRRLKDGLNVPSGRSRNIVLDRGRLFLMTNGSGVYRFATNLTKKD